MLVNLSQICDAAKKQHMKKVFSQKPSSLPLTSSDLTSGATSSQAMQGTVTSTSPIPSVTVEECGITNISESALRSKAQKLVLETHVVKFPWSSGSKDRLVKGSTSARPHLVTTNSKNVYMCDKTAKCSKDFLSVHTLLPLLIQMVT